MNLWRWLGACAVVAVGVDLQQSYDLAAGADLQQSYDLIGEAYLLQQHVRLVDQEPRWPAVVHQSYDLFSAIACGPLTPYKGYPAWTADFGDQAGRLYWMARREEGIMGDGSREPGGNGSSSMLRWPRSFVNATDQLNHTKTHHFSFVGSLSIANPKSLFWGPRSVYVSMCYRKQRRWVLPFVKGRFTDADFFKDTSRGVTGHVALGAFDRTPDNAAGHVQDRPHLECTGISCPSLPYDQTYFQVLAQSKVTLCPAGDQPYSFRFFEAAMAGSICILEKDWHAGGKEGWAVTQKIGWHYYLLRDDPEFDYPYRADWAAENRAKFIRFHTFIEGENMP